MSPGMEISEQPKYFGYVYMWCDTKRNKYYIGSHKGTIHDKYQSGSSWVNRIIKKRPDTMKFRVLEYYYGTCREELYSLESKWLIFYNVENNKSFYNFKNTARGGMGPFKHKGKKRVEYTPGWIDHRKGKTLEEIYSDPESVRNRLRQTQTDYYLKNGHGIKKGKKHKNIDPRLGKSLEEIYGYRKLVNPERPFIVTIQEPNKPMVELLCSNENEFFNLTKMEQWTLQILKEEKRKVIKRRQSTSKHNFDVGTILELKFVNDNP